MRRDDRNATLSQPRVRAHGACKHFFAEKILLPGEFTSPAQRKETGAPAGPRACGDGCDIDKPRNLAKSVTVE